MSVHQAASEWVIKGKLRKHFRRSKTWNFTSVINLTFRISETHLNVHLTPLLSGVDYFPSADRCVSYFLVRNVHTHKDKFAFKALKLFSTFLTLLNHRKQHPPPEPQLKAEPAKEKVESGSVVPCSNSVGAPLNPIVQPSSIPQPISSSTPTSFSFPDREYTATRLSNIRAQLIPTNIISLLEIIGIF